MVRDGLAVLAPGKVAAPGVLEAAYLVDRMLTGRDDLRKVLVQNKVRVAVMAPRPPSRPARDMTAQWNA